MKNLWKFFISILRLWFKIKELLYGGIYLQKWSSVKTEFIAEFSVAELTEFSVAEHIEFSAVETLALLTRGFKP